MKFKECFALYKGLVKSKNLVILKCPYCNSFDIKYYKDTLKEEKQEFKEVKDFTVIEYGVSCNKCGGMSMISEYWGK